MEGTVSLQKSTMANLELMQDNIESYSRRSCLRIHGIPVEEKEENEKPLSILEGCYKEMDLTFDPQEIDRVHRVGQEYIDRVTGKKVKSLIVKFKSWKSREKFYRARPRTYVNGKKKPGRPLFLVSVDLTKRRYNLLRSAMGMMNQNSNIKFIFADINCSLAIKINEESLKYFNTKQELNSILSKY